MIDCLARGEMSKKKPRNPHAALVKKRWQKMSKAERSAYARRMARARWEKKGS